MVTASIALKEKVEAGSFDICLGRIGQHKNDASGGVKGVIAEAGASEPEFTTCIWARPNYWHLPAKGTFSTVYVGALEPDPVLSLLSHTHRAGAHFVSGFFCRFVGVYLVGLYASL